jgi:mannose-6-phosphate isomerase-like protein (cupin superfamily)
MIVIPKGTQHAGTKTDGRPFKAIAIKTPPQGPTDTVMMPE